MATNLNFLAVDLNGASNIDFEDIKLPKKESFCVTQEMLDNCDINESVTVDSISVQKLLQLESASESKTESQIPTERTQPLKENEKTLTLTPVKQNISDESLTDEQISIRNDTQSDSSSANERCEDTIFGELIVAMLKKMKPEDKKRAKKEIMNILL